MTGDNLAPLSAGGAQQDAGTPTRVQPSPDLSSAEEGDFHTKEVPTHALIA